MQEEKKKNLPKELLPSYNAATPRTKKAPSFCCQRLPCAIFHLLPTALPLVLPRPWSNVVPCFCSFQEGLKDFWHPHQIPPSGNWGILGLGRQHIPPHCSAAQESYKNNK